MIEYGIYNTTLCQWVEGANSDVFHWSNRGVAEAKLSNLKSRVGSDKLEVRPFQSKYNQLELK